MGKGRPLVIPLDTPLVTPLTPLIILVTEALRPLPAGTSQRTFPKKDTRDREPSPVS